MNESLFWSSRSCRGQNEPNEGLFYTAALNWGALSYCIPGSRAAESRNSHFRDAPAPVEVVVRVTLTRWRRFSARAPCERAMRSCSARESSGCVPEPSRPRFESRVAFISQPRVCSHWQTVRDRVFWSSDPHVLYPRSPRPIADHSPSTPPRLFPTHRPAAPGA